jgi:hypothetical protein
MARLNTALINAVNKKVIQAYESLYYDIDGGMYITNAPRDITIGGDTYVSLGAMLGFSSVEENRLFTATNVTITLSGIPSYEGSQLNFIAQILQNDYVDREVKIYRSFFAADQYIDSFLMFSGRMDSPVIQDDPADTTTVAVTCSSHWVDYERANGVITNDARQQALYPGDLGFSNSAHVIKDIQWKP